MMTAISLQGVQRHFGAKHVLKNVTLDIPEGQFVAMSDGGVVNLETGFPYDTVRALMRKGHVVEFADGPYGGYQAIARDPATGVYTGASESRKDGQAAGY